MAQSDLTISCSECAFEGTSTCDDCVVSFLLDRDPMDAIIIDASTARAVRLLGDVGLVPELRHRRAAG